MQRKKQTKSETDPIITRPIVELTMTIEGAHLRGSLSRNMPTGHIVDFSTHTSTICIRSQVLLVAYYKDKNANTPLFFPSVFHVLFLNAYRILFYAISLSFLNSLLSFAAAAPPPPVFRRPRRTPSLPGG
jgi:hypothetical protein